jgi:hypothetical protein
MNNDAKSLTAVIGQRIAEIRTHTGVRQEDVAASARALGLRWTRATVAGVEAGRRQLTPEELLLLPYVIQHACPVDAPFGLAELIPEEASVQLPGGVVDGAFIHTLLAPEGGVLMRSPTQPGGVHDEVVVKAARRLGVQPHVITSAARRLWGRSLPDERDRRLAEQDQTLASAPVTHTDHGPDKVASKARVRASRGHVTRKLLDELRQHLEAREGRQ